MFRFVVWNSAKASASSALSTVAADATKRAVWRAKAASLAGMLSSVASIVTRPNDWRHASQAGVPPFSTREPMRGVSEKPGSTLLQTASSKTAA